MDDITRIECGNMRAWTRIRTGLGQLLSPPDVRAHVRTAPMTGHCRWWSRRMSGLCQKAVEARRPPWRMVLARSSRSTAQRSWPEWVVHGPLVIRHRQCGAQSCAQARFRV